MKILHTMLRVADLEKSIEFYTTILGMTLFKRQDYPEGKFTLAFVGFGDEMDGSTIELTHNWETKSYDHGNAFGHIAIKVTDVYQSCKEIHDAGGNVVGPAGKMKHGETVLAFVKDPDGYMIELLG